MANRAMSYSDYYRNREEDTTDEGSIPTQTGQNLMTGKKKKKKYDKATVQRRLDMLRS